MKAMQLALRIGDAFHREIPIKFVFESPTIKDQARIIRNGNSVGRMTSLVPIRKYGKGAPLFCVHPIFGLAHCYIELANLLGPSQSLYGIQSCGLEDSQTPFKTIPEMAAYYFEAIREVQPHGPYQLAGWSMGALAAYEMAQQITAAGESVSLLALMDGRPQTSNAVKFSERDWNYEIRRIENDNLREMAGQEQKIEIAPNLQDEDLKASIFEEMKSSGKIPDGISFEQYNRFIRITAINKLACDCYQLKPYPGKLILLRTPVTFEQDRSYGWSELAMRGVEIYEIPGAHDTFLSSPTVERISEILKEHINGSKCI